MNTYPGLKQAIECLRSEVHEAIIATTDDELVSEIIDILAALVLVMLVIEGKTPGRLARAAFNFGSKATARKWPVDLTLWIQRTVIAAAVKTVAGGLRSDSALGTKAANICVRCIVNHVRSNTHEPR